MKTQQIIDLQKERNRLKTEAHKPNTDDSTWSAFPLVRNILKYAIRSARAFHPKVTLFLQTAEGFARHKIKKVSTSRSRQPSLICYKASCWDQ